ncbi:MAG: hypothetical protein ABWX62_08655, partial [Microterricola sp.]
PHAGAEPWLWERPLDVDDWEVPEDEVTEALEWIMKHYDVWKLYGDPPHWTETLGSWAARWPEQIEEWFTARRTPMAYALRQYVEALDAGITTHPDDEDFTRHIGNAGRKDLKYLDDFGEPLWILQKQEMEKKFDAAMAAVLSWKATLDARKAGAKPRKKARVRVRRIR